MYNESNENR
uniref:Uncharacterized protein n=1 Tax=Bracon brevicornis TaxID=1563983 RepID=A0A6V7L145_9HYME